MSDYQTDFPCCDAKGGHNTADRLIEIERRFNATFDDLDTRDIHWLISEVRRYRDEENPNQAAKYYRTIVTQRQMIENQAATIEQQAATLKQVELALHGSALAGAKTVNAGLLSDILGGVE